MSENRDVYLRNLGIGEIWQLREVHPATPPAVISATPVASVSVLQARAIDLLVLGEFPDSQAGSAEAERLFANIIAAIDLKDGQHLQQISWVESRASLTHMPGDGGDDSAVYRSALQSALEAVRPRVILVFGQRAAQVLLDLSGDETLEGLRSSAQVFQGIPVVVTHTPTFLLTHRSSKRATWMDLCRVKALLS